ncbi:MAG: universal stress protein [Phenylobacterium sp.]|uniref:universal stress protein n=1 Tax=Phenylobacterium sp. TaxID=1871053 RepID=UPI002734BA7A|nr:universal stress protein [Phenylobacterium sp.]MDP1642540.1 universal stress protein [Phenylobacterium sp.]MDP3118067.1 universal stress protein [Phenylobacterium sp.]
MSEMSANTAALGGVLVHVEPGEASRDRVQVAAALARSMGGRLIGLGAEMAQPLVASPYGGVNTAEWVVAMNKQIDDDLIAAQAAFNLDSAGIDSEWRAMREMPARALAAAARACDVVVVSAHPQTNYYRAADPAEVVMRSGRPVLVTPAKASPLDGRAVVLAWKDTREARRALQDGLPFLQRAEQVVVVAVCAQDEAGAVQRQVDDVIAYLSRRGVRATAKVSIAPDAGVVGELNATAQAIGADLIIAGAYGQSRLREWVFGGVTRTLMDEPTCHLLLSH